MAVLTSRREARPSRLVMLLAHTEDHPRIQRVRSAVHPMTHVFQSGAANGAINAYGWLGIAVVPVVMAISLLLTRLLGHRSLA